MNTQANANVRQSELDKFGALAQRWWGEAARLRTTGSRVAERPAMEGRAGTQHHGWSKQGWES